MASTDVSIHAVFALLVVRAFAVDVWGTMIWLAVITIALCWVVVDGLVGEDVEPTELAEWLLLMGLVPLIAVLAERRERAARRFAGLYHDAAERLLAGEEAQRRMVAQDLHDGVGQGLGALLLTIDALAASHADEPAAAPLLERARHLAETVLDEVRGVVSRLQPAPVERDGLVSALRDLVAHAGIPAELTIDPEARPEDLPARLADRALPGRAGGPGQRGTAQRGIGGVGRHPWIARRRPGHVVDDGRGFADGEARGRGIGLLGMTERAARAGGEVEITSRRGTGTLVVLSLPMAGPRQIRRRRRTRFAGRRQPLPTARRDRAGRPRTRPRLGSGLTGEDVASRAAPAGAPGSRSASSRTTPCSARASAWSLMNGGRHRGRRRSRRAGRGLRARRTDRPDVLLLDLSLGERTGWPCFARSSTDIPSTRVLIVSMHRHAETVRQAFVAGAAGYVVKSARGTELVDAIHAVARGDQYVHSSVAGVVIEDSLRWQKSGQVVTAREREILLLVGAGRHAPDMARQLGISEHTVRRHIANITEKLGVRGVSGLREYVAQHGLLLEQSLGAEA